MDHEQIAPAFAGIRRAEISGVIIRADGSVEDLGILSSTNFPAPRERSAAPSAALGVAVIAAGLLLHRLTRRA